MTDIDSLRIFGVYRQRQPGLLMSRVKLPGGFMSPQQARDAASLCEKYGSGTVHLTTRGSLEIHGVPEERIETLLHDLAGSGLTTRGGCGGAVRSVACGSPASPLFPLSLALSSFLHRFFSEREEFENLPRKFKIGVFSEADGRQLIQDAGIVLRGRETFDLYAAGGLGREPLAAMLLEEEITLERAFRLIRGLVELHRESAQGKRLKVMRRSLGDDEFRRRALSSLPGPLPLLLSAEIPQAAAVRVPVFSGELPARELRRLADLAGVGGLCVTPDQDLLLLGELSPIAGGEAPVSFRVCPGTHECRLGLSPTREVARAVSDLLGPAARSLSWAISGCPNSCSHPQLADCGILTARLAPDRAPLFDLYRREGNGFGSVTRSRLTLGELLDEIRSIG